MDETRVPPSIVPGVIVERSRLKSAVWLALPVFLFMFGLAAVARWWNEGRPVMPGGPQNRTFWNGLRGVLCLVTSPLILGYIVTRLMAREKLVIGDDRFQVIRRVAGKDVVAHEIPYANIGTIAYQVLPSERRIGIDLRDPGDAATYLPDQDVERHKEQTEWHYVVGGGYKVGVSPLHKMLLERMQRAGWEAAS